MLTNEVIESYKLIHDEHERRFAAGFKNIAAHYAFLPTRNKFTEQINATYDDKRVSLILHSLIFLKTYHKLIKQMLNDQTNDHTKNNLEGLSYSHIREIFTAVSMLIFNASGNFRGKYKSLLSPAPFSWETFEHFGAFMIDAKEKSLFIHISPSRIREVKWIAAERFAREQIVEASLELIIENDLDKLIDLFKVINDDMLLNKPHALVKPFQFFAIKAITKRAMDVETMVKLFNLTNIESLQNETIATLDFPGQIVGGFHLAFSMFRESRPNPYVMVNSKTKIHAALRRIEMIGELLTGKYFSSGWKALDETIDWDAFSTLRDGISHQDEGDNYDKTQALIANKDLLLGILETDLPMLHERLQKLAGNRDKAEPVYIEGGDEQFCKTIIAREKILYAEALAKNTPPTVRAMKTKLSKEERTQKRQDDINAAAAKQKAITDKYAGLEFIRAAAHLYSQNAAGNPQTLTPKKRVEIALAALEDISEILESEANIILTDATQTDTILQALEASPSLYDAMNYNIEQFLQCLDHIKEYKMISKCSLVKDHYDSLRYLRNHIAHGAMLIDTEEYHAIGPMPQLFNVVVAIRALSIYLVPALKSQINYMNATDAAVSSITKAMKLK